MPLVQGEHFHTVPCRRTGDGDFIFSDLFLSGNRVQIRDPVRLLLSDYNSGFHRRTAFLYTDGLSLLVLILGIVGFFADHGRFWPEFLRRMAGLVICGGGLWLLRILTGGGIGLGDVKMMAACGFFLGWPHGFCAMAQGMCLPLYSAFRCSSQAVRIRKTGFL